MKIFSILGSPRKNGNTDKVLSSFEELVSATHSVDRVNIRDHHVNGCLGCGICQETDDTTGCIQEDDAAALFERMLAADAVVYATPLYCWGFSAQLKAFIDRHYCLVTGAGSDQWKSLVRDKPMALLVTCAGPIDDNADLIQVMFERMSSYLRSRCVGRYVVPFCTTPDQLKPVARQMAQRMADDLTRTLSA